MTEDIFSQFAALLAAALLIPSFVFLSYAVNHRDMEFWGVAGLGLLLTFIGAALAATRNLLPHDFIPLIANVLISCGYIMNLRALRMVKNFRVLEHLDLVTLGVYLVGLIILYTFANSYPNRVALISAFISLNSTLIFLMVYWSVNRISRLGDAALALFAIGNVTFSIFRGVSAIMDTEANLLAFALWDQIFFIWSITAVFCFAIGLFLNGTAIISNTTHSFLKREKDLNLALTTAIQGQKNLQKLMLHELKRPINALKSAVEVIREDPSDASRLDLKRLSTLAETMNQYILRIAEYEDIEILIRHHSAIELGLSEALKDIEIKWNIVIRSTAAMPHCLIKVDPLLFDICVGNLIENAIKFGGNHIRPEIRVSFEKDFVILDIIDDGTGIEKNEAENVFQQFYRIENVRIGSVNGCGLGLYVAREIARSHGGNCQVYSQAPSTLRLSFPCKLKTENLNDHVQ
ncbi:sensor histidine kinase [Tabrizicola sp.]|uniref:sensor histidine kinase n=1 Tax=Tabrizicola sp. TaxID=2005166 RepID=UPI003D2C53F7